MARKMVPEETGSERYEAPDRARQREQEHVQVLNPTPPSSLAENLEGFRYQTAKGADGSTALVPPPRPNAVVRSAVGQPRVAAASSEDQELAARLQEELEEALVEVGEKQAALLSSNGEAVVDAKAEYDEAVRRRDEVAARLQDVQKRLSPDALVRFYVVEGEKEKRVGGDVIRPGKVVDSRNYDPKMLRRGGVRLKEIRPEERDQY